MAGSKFILPVLAVVSASGAAAWYLSKSQTAPASQIAPVSQTFALLSPADLAALKDAPEPPPPNRGLDITKTDGPLIRVASPSGATLASPVNFDIQIEPNGGVPVDMSSIRIEYKIGPVWVNVTRTIMKYATIKGSRLSAKGAELPAGSHLLRVSVADNNARQTRATVRFKVSK